MLVSHRHRFIFLKPGKTAGTSVELYLEPLCTPPGHQPKQSQPRPLISEHGIVGVRAAGNARDLSAFYSHIRAKKLKELLEENIWKNYLKVATVRNPFDMAISKFHHFIRPAKEGDLAKPDEFIDAFRCWVREVPGQKLQNSPVVMVNGSPCIDFAIRYETLLEDVTLLLERLDLNPENLGAIPETKRNHRPRGIPLQEYYDLPTADTVRTKAGPDFEIFGYPLDLP